MNLNLNFCYLAILLISMMMTTTVVISQSQPKDINELLTFAATADINPTTGGGSNSRAGGLNMQDLLMLSKPLDVGGRLRRAVQETSEKDNRLLDAIVNMIRELRLVSPYCKEDLVFTIRTVIELAIAAQQTDINCVNSNPDEQLLVPNSFKCQCLAQSLSNFRNYSWPMDAFDSFGRMPAGVLDVNLWWIGDYDQCMSIRAPRDTGTMRTKFCKADVSVFEAPILQYDSSCEGHRDPIPAGMPCCNNSFAWDAKKCSSMAALHYGLCLPESCTSDDGFHLMQALFEYFELQDSFQEKGRCPCIKVSCHEHDVNIDKDPAAKTMLAIIILFISLMVFGTAFDWFIYQPVYSTLPSNAQEREQRMQQIFGNNPSGASHSDRAASPMLDHPPRLLTKAEYFAQQTAFARVMLSFSIYTNGRKILDTRKRPDQIHCLNGFRFLSLCWVILGHTYYWTVPTLDNIRAAFPLVDQIANQVILNATYCVDAFYLLSGILTTSLWLKDTKKTKGARLKQPRFWIMFYLHRYLRLTPVYALVLGIDIALFKYMTDGPFWDQTNGLETALCRKEAWWSNLLYVNNFFYLYDMCMSWTWYLANDMQFYVFSPLVLVVLWFYEYVGVALIVLLLILTGVIRAVMIVSRHYPPIFMGSVDPRIFEIEGPYFKDIYIKPYARCGPYLVGMILGYILWKMDGKKIKIPKWGVWLGWILSTSCCLGLLFGMWDYSRKAAYPNIVASYIYAASCRSLWAAGLGWVIFACITGNAGPVDAFLSWKFWIPLSRITYCAYLIHPFVVHGTYMSRLVPFHFDTHIRMVWYFMGHVIVSYSIAFLVTLAFESPMIGIEQLIFGAAAHRAARRDSVAGGMGRRGSAAAAAAKEREATTPEAAAAAAEAVAAATPTAERIDNNGVVGDVGAAEMIYRPHLSSLPHDVIVLDTIGTDIDDVISGERAAAMSSKSTSSDGSRSTLSFDGALGINEPRPGQHVATVEIEPETAKIID